MTANRATLFLVSQRLMPPHATCLDFGGLSIRSYFTDTSAHQLGR